MRGKMIGKTRSGIIILLSLYMSVLFCIHAIAAQEPAFRLDTDSLNLQKGVSCNVVISLVNAQGAQIISIDQLENFDVLSQSQSSSTTIVGNTATSQIDVYIALMPKVTGQFSLKANIQLDGKIYETNTLEVTVTENADNTGEIMPDLFVNTVISHEEAYLGEKIVLTYELYSRENIDSYGFIDYTAIDGVVAKDTSDDQLKTESVYIGGNKYTMREIKRLIIDPMKSGEYIIPSFNLQVNVIDDSRSAGFFGFFSSTTPKYLQTEEKKLSVKPLPSEGKPANFSGIVGELTLDSYYSRNELNYGDSLVLQINTSGSCNLDGTKSILGNGISGFTVYENQKNLVESVKDNLYYAQKTFEAILIPEKTGICDIPPIFVSYFNPVTGKYETAEMPGTTINVLGNMPSPNITENVQNIQAGSIETIRINQVNYADISNDEYYSMQIPKELAHRILIILIVFIILAFGLIWLILETKKQNTKLKALYKQLMKVKDINEIYNLFNNMIKYCYGVNLKTSPKNIIHSTLHDADLSIQITDIMDYIESSNVHDDKGIDDLKNKIKKVYTSKICKVRPAL